MRRREALLGLSATALASACGEAIDSVATGDEPIEVAVLDEELSALKTSFNAGQGDVRLLFIVGPSCGPCLRGLTQMSQALGPDFLAHARLHTLVVHVPTLSAELRHTQRAARLMRGASVRHFWDPSGASGDVVSDALDIEQYAWDVWLTYGPDAAWDEAAPPAPAAWRHQLCEVDAGARLDPEAFAADVRARMERLG